MNFNTLVQYKSGTKLADDKGNMYLVKSSVDLKHFGVGDGYLTTVEVLVAQVPAKTKSTKWFQLN